ncbi:MAG TPA: hypothetical protein PKC30_10135 [Saprospiraceae bacterium]|nr:hypothetical protein [Saprospiraceae bacterium]
MCFLPAMRNEWILMIFSVAVSRLLVARVMGMPVEDMVVVIG